MNRYHRIVLLTILGAVLALGTLTGVGKLFAGVLSSQYAPEQVNYQGYLTDSGGNPISGTVTLAFSIWDAGTGGNQIWSETHNNVPVTSGYFSVQLGSQGTPLTTDDFKGSPRYLQVVYGAITFPRQIFGSVPYALVSNYATEAMTATYALNTAGSGVDWEYVVIVAKSGGDYTSITDAISNTSPSSSSRYLILVMPGVYTETVTLPEYVHLKGSGVASTRITSDANGDQNTQESDTLEVPANSQVSDLAVYNTSTTNDGVAVRVHQGNSSTILNNVYAYATESGGTRHVAFYLNSGTPKLTHVYGEADGANSGGTPFNWGLFNSASAPTIYDSTLVATGSNAAGLRMNGGNPIIKESTISGQNSSNGQGINTSGGGTHTVKIDRSTIIGDSGSGSSIASTDDYDFFVGASMLDGDVDVTASATIKCAQSYDGAYVDLGPTCN